MRRITQAIRMLREPRYVFRPAQLARRLGIALGRNVPAGPDVTSVQPWGLPLTYDRTEYIGHTIFVCGLYDLAVCETLWRLVDSGETALDIGANIGQMSGLMARRAGRNGRVIAFEPHPQVSARLARNAQAWRETGFAAPVEVHALALSKQAGTAALVSPSDFQRNQGSSRIVLDDEPSRAAGASQHTTELARLDEVIDADASIGVAKMDVETHERDVLEGATALLERRRVRDWVFEETGDFPSPASELLETFGYRVFRVEQTFFGLRLTTPREERAAADREDPPSYIATLDPQRVASRFARRGWQVLRSPAIDGDADDRVNLAPA